MPRRRSSSLHNESNGRRDRPPRVAAPHGSPLTARGGSSEAAAAAVAAAAVVVATAAAAEGGPHLLSQECATG